MSETEMPMPIEIENKDSTPNRGGSIFRHVLQAPFKWARKLAEGFSSKKTQ